MASHQVFSRGFFRNKGLDFQTRLILGRAAHGGSDVGEVLATVDRISGRADWPREWEATAARTEDLADRLRAADDAVGARSAYLRAANYWACAVDAAAEELGGDQDLAAAFRRHRGCWDAFVDCGGGAHVRLAVPYERTTLPGYLLRPDATGTPRPTLVITNGSDGAVSGLWGSAAAGAVARGWNAFVYDGPGQQSMLFDQHTSFRPDWEAVLTPVVDALVTRPDVDADRLLAYGISQGGYWVPRALAFEHRIVAAVADPGVVDVSTTWTGPLGRSMRKLLDRGDRAAFDRDLKVAMHVPALRRLLTFRSRPYGSEASWFDLFTEVRGYALDRDLAGRITTPIMIANPEDEQFWPGQSEQLAELLGDLAHLVEFAAAEGANYHCQPMGRLLTDERMFEWLACQLAAGGRVPAG